MTKSTRVLGLGKAKAIFLFSLFIGCHTAVATPLTVGDEDDRTSSAIPEKITDLQGKLIDYDTFKQYVTTERPWDYDKMYLLYNVGTGKFLNVGSYWGTHATLSDVPRPFWFQRRNEKIVSNQWSYIRYPEAALKGEFNYDFFHNITLMQIGSSEGKHSKATYNYIRIVNISDGSTVKELRKDFTPNGTTFTDEYAVDFNTQRIEAEINLNNIDTKYVSGKGGQLTTIFSVGQDISKWDKNILDFHIYGSKNEDDEVELRAQCVYPDYNDDIAKTTINVTQQNADNIAKIVIGKGSITINNTECLVGNKNLKYENPLKNFFTLTNLQVGSTQGDNRTHATYDYVRLYKASIYDEDPTHVIAPNVAANGRSFVKTFEGNLSDKTIEAEIDLSSCNPDQKAKDENILSIGTAIKNWGTGSGEQNIHLYYNGTRLKVEAVNSNHTGSNDKPTIKYTANLSGTIKLKFNKLGLYINDALIENFDASNEVIAYLLNSATSIQVGSEQGDNRSYATYNSLTTNTIHENVVEPGYVGDGKTPFGTAYVGNLQNLVIEGDINIGTCKTKTENILSIGSNITEWGYKNGYTSYNIHFYYMGNNQVEIDPAAENDKFRKTITLGNDKKMHVLLNKHGLYINDVQLYTASNDIIAYLLNSATELQVGSKEGNTRSNATYNSLTVKEEATSEDVTENSTTAEAKSMRAATAKAESTEAGSYTYLYNKVSVAGFSTSQDVTGINFSNGDYIEADIDLSGCNTYTENVFSVGAKIADWGNTLQIGNVHIYYLDKDDDNYRLYVVYVNKDHSDDFKRLFTVPIDNTMHLKLSKAGLVINGRNIYPDVNPMPQISYLPGYEGEIVRFKYADAKNKVYEIDNTGHYVVVAPDKEGYDNAHGINDSHDGYLYTQESRSSKTMPLFISSRFTQERTSNNNEGVFFSWAPYLQNNDKWGTIGVFADRNLPQGEVTESLNCSQWFFEPLDDENHTYHIYLKMKNTKVPYRNESHKCDYTFKSGNFYLQATTENIYGNNLEDYSTGTMQDINGVEAICSLPENEKYAQWRVFDVTEYHKLFDATNSEMSSMLDLTYSLRDPSFNRESNELDNWKTDSSLDGKIRIGYEQFSKKKTSDTDYTDDDGKKGTDKTKDEHGNDQYISVNNRTNNHARYMGVDVRNGGYGDFYQYADITYPGWYAINCGGMSTVGAQLFVQMGKDENNLSTKIKQSLHTLTQEEYDKLNATDNTIAWPYDKIDNTHGMPMYNAIVAMSDKNAPNGEENVKKYTTQVAFYIDPTLFEQYGKQMKIRFGIEVPQVTTQAAKETEGEGNTANVEWTVFDNFHLLFGGISKDPNLVLDENYTSLDYLDKSIHTFTDRPMHLNRTFAANEWNTLVLPVSLTKEQFTSMFDKEATVKLVKISKIENNKLIFVNETEDQDGYYLKANKPYLIYTSQAQGNQPEYTATIYNRADYGKTYTDYVSPANHFMAAGVTLKPTNTNESTQQSYYDFANSADCKRTIDGKTYDYVVNTDDDVATDETGTRTATFYGTLCKTYEGKTILTGRPNLADGKSYYMKANGGNNFYHRSVGKPYGLLGFRCWFVYDESASASKYAFEINGVTDNTTTIDEIERNDGWEKADRYSNAIYNMNGQKVGELSQLKQLPAGIYIVNGKKYIINK